MATDFQTLLRNQLTGMTSGAASQGLGNAARNQAQSSAMGVGSSQASVSPALAARQAQQAAAQGSVQADVAQAQLAAQQRAQAIPLLAELAAQEQARKDRFLGLGLNAAGSGLGMILGGLGGPQRGLPSTPHQQAQPASQGPNVTPAVQQARAPLKTPAPQGAEQQAKDPLEGLLSLGGTAAGFGLGGPLGGLLMGKAGSIIPGLFRGQ